MTSFLAVRLPIEKPPNTTVGKLATDNYSTNRLVNHKLHTREGYWGNSKREEDDFLLRAPENEALRN